MSNDEMLIKNIIDNRKYDVNKEVQERSFPSVLVDPYIKTENDLKHDVIDNVIRVRR